MDVGLAGLQDALRKFGLMLSIRPHLRRHVSNDLFAFAAVGVGSSLGAERYGSQLAMLPSSQHDVPMRSPNPKRCRAPHPGDVQ